MSAPAASSRRLDPELPIFLLPSENGAVLYTPGHVAAVGAGDLGAMLDALRGAGTGRFGRTAAALRAGATRAMAEWARRAEAPFEPESLLIYVTNQCAQACTYCYSAPGRGGGAVSEAAVAGASRWVAGFCAAQGKPLRVVFHGGGEPTARWGVVERLVELTREIAAAAGIPWWGYLATGGVLEPERAQRAATIFDAIGLSCDGPPEIQDRQRPLSGGRPSSGAVAAAARGLAAAGARWSVRATITPETMARQAEIVRWLHAELGARELRFEPVYRVGPAGRGFSPADAQPFFEAFREAERQARALGCILSLSGVRPDELHGPHCSATRALHLLPDGTLAGCFFETSAPGRRGSIGRVDATGVVHLDPQAIRAHRRRAHAIPEGCEGCVAVFHCARGCPETCVVEADAPPSGFRCILQRALCEAWILEAAASIPAPAPAAPRGAFGRAAQALMETAPPSVDRAAVSTALAAASRRLGRGPRALPRPLWALRPLEQAGASAWPRITQAGARGARRPLSVYVHVPFCVRRCGFCDCYSVPWREPKEIGFRSAVLAEIDAFASLPGMAERPVTTVHFGGGTPGVLSEAAMESVLRTLRERLGVGPRTEWAVETTAALLAPGHLAALERWGIRRLHVGVQTLEGEVRGRLGRVSAPDDVLRGLRGAVARGFVVSVDVLYGLPGQGLRGLLDTLQRLSDAGVHGVSLYGLQVTPRNTRFLARLSGEAASGPAACVEFLAADAALLQLGFAKNHATHYARPEDENLYFRHAARGEDLLALGPSADGAFDGYHYRKPALDAYAAGAGRAMEGGLEETPSELRAGLAAAGLLAGSVGRAALLRAHAERLADGWLEEGLVVARGDHLDLTGMGSWLVSQMIDEVRVAAGRPTEASGAPLR